MKTYKSINEDGVAERLLDGQVGVIPTDTIYGIVCRANDETAVNRLYSMKSRVKKPGTIIAANIDQLVELGIKRRYLKAVEQYWPGPTSVEIPHSIEYLNQGTGRQAVRVPDDENLLKLLNKTGPLQTTSANLPDKPPANTINEAVDYFGNKLDFYVDGGNLSNRSPSTIIRIIDDAVEVVRKGAGK